MKISIMHRFTSASIYINQFSGVNAFKCINDLAESTVLLLEMKHLTVNTSITVL
jgi:hypothetical protein